MAIGDSIKPNLRTLAKTRIAPLGGYGWLVIGLIGVDVVSREILFRTPLYQDAAFSQPAIRLQGAITGLAVFLALMYVIVRIAKVPGRAVRFPGSAFEFALVLLLPLAVIGFIVGYFEGNQLSYLLGDTYRLGLVPCISFIVVQLTATRAAALRVLVAFAIAGALSSSLVLIGDVRALAACASAYARGEPNLLLLVVILAALGSRVFTTHDWRFYALAAVGGLTLFLSFVSLGRTSWGTSVLVLLLTLLVFRTAALRGLLAVGAFAAVAIGLVLLPLPICARPAEPQATSGPTGSESPAPTERTTHVTAPPLAVQLEQRVGDLVRGNAESSSEAISASSLVVRKVEADEAIRDLARLGPVGFITGRGNGAEFPSSLPIVDPTTRPGQHHQIHVTWVSVLYRNGLLGLSVVLFLVVAALRTAWRALVVSRRQRLDVVASVAIAMWLLASTVALTTVYGLIGDFSWGVVFGLLGAIVRGWGDRTGRLHRASAATSALETLRADRS
jgi:hypothetical protein